MNLFQMSCVMTQALLFLTSEVIEADGEKSGIQYTCSICNKTFHRANLSRHMQKYHEEIRNVSCSHCDSSFMNKKKLKKHIAEMHKEVKLYACKSCNKSFDFLSYLKKHMESAHEGKLIPKNVISKNIWSHCWEGQQIAGPDFPIGVTMIGKPGKNISSDSSSLAVSAPTKQYSTAVVSLNYCH